MIDIAKVQALTYVEQEVWCEHPRYGERGWGQSLEELAFQLRDEAVKQYAQGFHTARQKVSHCLGYGVGELWWIEEAQPIHWILAALEAKENEDAD